MSQSFDTGFRHHEEWKLSNQATGWPCDAQVGDQKDQFGPMSRR